ncbi:MAG: pyridoxamine 5'-phosphate oxidase family protein [Desulfobacterales bacterium]|nr:pyridoxamine 5'-phosphate oxidase family protein [Desulfobacterales bacterium]
MTLKEYFNNTRGTGVLATADNEGRTDAAIYSRPHIMDDGSLAFIMREHLSLNNLQSNPYATFLFMEHDAHIKGMRLFMKKTGEDTNEELISRMTRRNLTPEEDKAAGPKHIVYFNLEKILALVGGNEIDMKIL